VVLLLMLPALAALRGSRGASSTMAERLVRWWLWITLALAVAITAGAAIGGATAGLVELLRPAMPFVLLAHALALAGLLKAWQSGPGDPEAANVLTYLALALTGAFLALGPRVFVGAVDVGSGLWRFDLLPVRLIIRAPQRLSLLLMLGAAVVAGLGLTRLSARLSKRATLALAVVALLAVNVDLNFRMHSFQDVPSPSAVDEWLAELPEDGATIEYPLLRNPWGIYRSQLYDRRIVNGHGYLVPAQLQQVEAEPDFSPEQLALLWEHFHPRFVVFRPQAYLHADPAGLLDTIEAQPEALVPRASFDQEYVYELVDRGRGGSLFRRWPLTALRDRDGLVVEGVVTPGRDDTVGEILVLLNNRILLRSEGAAVENPFSILLAYGRDDLVPGMNTFEIRAGYRFAPTAPPHPIGTTGVNLRADVLIVANRSRSRVEINGRALAVDKGYFLAVVDAATGEVLRTGQFDVSTDEDAAPALVEFVQSIPDGSPVVVATEFDASRHLTRAAVSALRELGLDSTLRGRFGRAHAAVGVKGAPRGTALEDTHRLGLTLELGEIDKRVVQLHSLSLR
jgi:hypothetical protein